MLSKEQAEDTIRLAVNEGSNTYSELSELVRNGTLTVRDYLRKVLNVSATSVSLAVVGLLGYAIYRSYRNSRSSSFNDFNDLNGYVYEPDPDIGRNRRSPENLEEVLNKFYYFYYFLFLSEKFCDFFIRLKND